MKELIEKISSYNLFNYLLPGILFVIFAQWITHYRLVQSNIFIALFFSYFVGMVINRIGSLIVEPILRKISFIKFADYAKFIAKSKTDPKLEILSEVNNTYRTLVALFLCLGLTKIYELIAAKLTVLESGAPYILIVALINLFAFSYRKQTNYITNRIKAHKENIS